MTLYRQYRSTSFAELIGQDTVTTLLQQALAQGRLAHAYLFSGPRGTGKTSTARLFARAANCLAPVTQQIEDKVSTFEACGKCASCVAQLENKAQDIIEIDAASNRGIEDIRALREQASYPPVLLRYKIYIIDEVHMLTNEAFNALLKTLEEPCSSTLFILATTELHKVPATIRSRCQLLRFQAGSVTAITKKLQHIVKSEKWQVEKEALTLIAEHAQGGFRDAETTLEQLATRHQPLTAEATSQALGMLPRVLIEALAKALIERDQNITSLLEQVKEVAFQRPDQVILQLITVLRSKISQSKDVSHLTFALTQLLEAFILERSSPAPLLPLELACLTIVQGQEKATQPFPGHAPVHSTAIQQRVGINEAPTPVIKPVVKASTPTITVMPISTAKAEVPVVELREVAISDIRRAWKEMVLDVGRTHKALAQLLRETVFHSAEDGSIVIQVRFKFHVDKLMEKKNKARIEDLLYQITHEKWTVLFTLSENMPKPTTHKEIGTGLEDATAVFGSK